MKCSIEGCPGHYENRTILHTVKRGEDVIVFEGVPVDVCDVCADTLLAPDTVRHIEKLLDEPAATCKQAPVYVYE